MANPCTLRQDGGTTAIIWHRQIAPKSLASSLMRSRLGATTQAEGAAGPWSTWQLIRVPSVHTQAWAYTCAAHEPSLRLHTYGHGRWCARACRCPQECPHTLGCSTAGSEGGAGWTGVVPGAGQVVSRPQPIRETPSPEPGRDSWAPPQGRWGLRSMSSGEQGEMQGTGRPSGAQAEGVLEAGHKADSGREELRGQGAGQGLEGQTWGWGRGSMR